MTTVVIMTTYNKDIGKLGEKYASDFLRSKGYIILENNFHTHWGEIDLIAKKDKKIYFIEVKTRVGESKGKPYEAVDFIKVKHLMRPIQLYLLKKNLKDYKLSLDVISVVLNADRSVKEIKYYKDVYSGREGR